MKKQFALICCLTLFSVSLFAGKPVSKEPSPLSVLESEEEKKSWCETDGYAIVLGRNLHYWLYDSYLYHDGDISELINEIVPKWFQSMDYFVVDDYEVSSPNKNLADSVKKLMIDNDSDVSITFVKTEDGKSDYICVNSYDDDAKIYSTYIFYGTKADRAKISPAEKKVKTSHDNGNAEEFIKELVKVLNKNGKSTNGDKFYENLKIAKNAGKLGTKTEDSYGDLLPDNAYDYIIRYIQKCRSKGPVNKYSIRAITHGTRAYYNVPQNYKIAVPMSDSSLADAMNSIPYKNY